MKIEGLLPVNKEKGKSSFSLVTLLRHITMERKIGHTGTLDPLASGVMIMLIGKRYTRLAKNFLDYDKKYLAKIFLGQATDTYDREGIPTLKSNIIPSKKEILALLLKFQGKIQQIPPMFSAKKVKGEKLYNLARKGLTIARDPFWVEVNTQLLEYKHPYLELEIICSKGTYIRALADDIGKKLGCYGHLFSLVRERVGPFHIKGAIAQRNISLENITPFIKKTDQPF